MNRLRTCNLEQSVVFPVGQPWPSREQEKKNLQTHSTSPRICFAPFLSRESNRHSRLLTLALNREDAQDISAVVRVRRCPSRAALHNFVVIFPAQALPCGAALCLGSCLGLFCPGLLFYISSRSDDEDEDGGEAGPRTPGHYKLET